MKVVAFMMVMALVNIVFRDFTCGAIWCVGAIIVLEIRHYK